MTALILLDLPPSSFCAIDLASFTTAPRFRGIKNIPPGVHFCYFSPTSDAPIDPSTTSSRITELDSASHPSSLHFRTGFFFAASPSTPHIIRKWCTKTETLLPESQIPTADIDAVKRNLPEIHREHLSPYEKLQVPEDKVAIWNTLAAAITRSQTTLTRILGPSWSCESARETTWEKAELDDAIRSKTEITGSRPLYGPEKPPGHDGNRDKEVLEYTRIDLKRTWPPTAMGRERTVWARDRSWVLTDIFRKLSPNYSDAPHDAESRATANSTAQSLAGDLPSSENTEDGQAALLAEAAVSFILTVLLANYSSTIQFKHILEISLTAPEAVKSHTKYFIRLLPLLSSMLKSARLIVGENASDDDEEGEAAPAEESVLEEFISGGDAWLVKLLRGFNRELKDVATGDVQDMRELTRLKEGFARLEKVCRRFGWYLDDQYVRKGMVDLPAEEGGGRVEVELEDMEGEDERGEFAPVIVEL
ncbi:hypothetical protein Dda_2164 [Drechslerella dactyloides]|uniref:Uncharacterized protein n=1 Tax=Drechslerella dactyloides TaxID=74499 RepID=A0AAD6J750_DREDA|nr:hypothetical protein Dda_2164 [Drechslerella dactyloides]